MIWSIATLLALHVAIGTIYSMEVEEHCLSSMDLLFL